MTGRLPAVRRDHDRRKWFAEVLAQTQDSEGKAGRSSLYGVLICRLSNVCHSILTDILTVVRMSKPFHYLLAINTNLDMTCTFHVIILPSNTPCTDHCLL